MLPVNEKGDLVRDKEEEWETEQNWMEKKTLSYLLLSLREGNGHRGGRQKFDIKSTLAAKGE